LLGIAKQPFQFVEVGLSKGNFSSYHIDSVFGVFKEEKHLFQLRICKTWQRYEIINKWQIYR